jgi:hypothetical protein
MAIELSKEEKIQIINSHLRNLAYSKYNLELDILQENAKTDVSAPSVASLELLVTEISSQISALDAELAAVSAV